MLCPKRRTRLCAYFRIVTSITRRPGMPEPHYGELLRNARERSGKSIDEMAALMALSPESYNELEERDEQIIDSVSLRKVVVLGKALNVDLGEFFSSGPARPRGIVS